MSVGDPCQYCAPGRPCEAHSQPYAPPIHFTDSYIAGRMVEMRDEITRLRKERGELQKRVEMLESPEAMGGLALKQGMVIARLRKERDAATEAAVVECAAKGRAEAELTKAREARNHADELIGRLVFKLTKARALLVDAMDYLGTALRDIANDKRLLTPGCGWFRGAVDFQERIRTFLGDDDE